MFLAVLFGLDDHIIIDVFLVSFFGAQRFALGMPAKQQAPVAIFGQRSQQVHLADVIGLLPEDFSRKVYFYDPEIRALSVASIFIARRARTRVAAQYIVAVKRLVYDIKLVVPFASIDLLPFHFPFFIQLDDPIIPSSITFFGLVSRFGRIGVAAQKIAPVAGLFHASQLVGILASKSFLPFHLSLFIQFDHPVVQVTKAIFRFSIRIGCACG
ncbi:hypothetical protein D9M72_471500 [compost metagenome]